MEALCDDLGIPIIELVIDIVMTGHGGQVVIIDCERLQRLRQKVFPLSPK